MKKIFGSNIWENIILEKVGNNKGRTFQGRSLDLGNKIFWKIT